MNTNLLRLALLLIGISGAASAVVEVPEIDPATGANALALVSGALLVFRSRRSAK